MEKLSEILKQDHGWTNDLRAFQLEALQAIAEGRDVIVHAATGSGKTAILAVLHLLPCTQGMVTLCVSPLIALQDEQVCTIIYYQINLTISSHKPGMDSKGRDNGKRVRNQSCSH